METRHVRRALAIVLIALAGVLLSAGIATAAPTEPYDKTECVMCHDQTTGVGATTKVNFKTSSGVDYAACAQCHWIGMSAYVPGSSYRHSHNGPQGCRGCHSTPWGYQDPGRTPSVATPLGYFNSATSASSTPAAIHAIHVNGSWPKVDCLSPNYCGSCHYATGCATCHTGIDQTKHTDHTYNTVSGTYAYAPGTMDVAGGSVPSPWPRLTQHTEAATCVNSSCHDTSDPAAVKFSSPDCVLCHPAKVVSHGMTGHNHSANQTTTIDTSMPASAAWTTVTATGKTCVGCHSMQIDGEHVRTTASTAALGCGACHNVTKTAAGDREAATTSTAGSWYLNPTCGTATYCHKSGTAVARHSNYTTAHVSTQTNCGLGCHDITNLATIHQNATQTVAGWPDNGGVAKSCNVCHRKDFSASTTDCQASSCHGATFTHPNEGAAHMAVTTSTANPSSSCIACHESTGDVHSGDIKLIHTARGCVVCHNNPSRIPNLLLKTPECVSCHDQQTDALSPKDYFPYNPNHYAGTESTHTANETGYEDGKACGACHYLEMNPEHTRVTNTPVWTCVQCHETNVDPWSGVAWNKTCAACHTGTTIMHKDKTTMHASTQTQCSGAGCHDITNVGALHSAATTTIAGIGTVTSCNVCHYNRDQIFGPIDLARKTTNCTVCHLGYSGTVHKTINGTDATHTAIAMTATVGAYMNKNTCATCHSAALKTAHTTVTVSLDSGHAAWTTPYCQDCHNSVYPEANSVTTIKTNRWSAQTCDQCHVANGHGKHSTNTTPTHTAIVGSVAAGASGCANSGCHDTTDVRAVHDKYSTVGCSATGSDSKGANTACHALDKQMTAGTIGCGSGSTAATKCHVNHTDTNHMPVHGVTDATSLGCLACHEAGATQSIATTMVTSIHSTTTIGTTVSGKVNDGCNICHGGSGWTDVAATAKTNLTSFQCAGCHNGTVVGTHVYNPYDPNHYDNPVVTHDATLSSSASTAGTSADYHGAAVSYSYSCPTCHSMNMKTEHWKSSTSTTTLSAYANSCVGCHEVKVDTWTNNQWTGSCAGVGNACHATQHTSMATKHNASTLVMSSPGTETGNVASAPTSQTILTEGFEAGTSAWTLLSSGSTAPSVNTTLKHAGTSALRFRDYATSDVLQAVTTLDCASSVTSVSVSFWYAFNSVTAAQTLYVDYSLNGGTTWTNVWSKVNTACTANTWYNALDVKIPANANRLRFRTGCTSITPYLYLDDITVEMKAPVLTWTETAIPAGSTADRSCGSGYLNGAANCHDVTDIADIHSRATTTIASVVYSDCKVCHRSATAVPSSANCQSAGCHAGINGYAHGTIWHTSQIASGAAGQIFSGTGFSSLWCKGCHDDGIDTEHAKLSAYTNTPCAVCHKKTTDSAAPTNVTASNTSSTIHGNSIAGNALCTDCHKTVAAVGTSLTIHAQRDGLDAAGTTTTVGGYQFNTGSTWSGHAMFTSNPGMKTASFIGVGTGITWPAETAANYLSGTWTNTSMVRCSDCHSYSGASGPHGAAMSINIDPNYPSPYATAASNGSSANGMNNTTNICAKCHSFNGTSTRGWGNTTTGKHGGDLNGSHNALCIGCHTRIPHAWKRPRLLGYRTDPVPYRSLCIQAVMAPASGAQANWTTAGNCQATSGGGVSCSSHGTAPNPSWP